MSVFFGVAHLLGTTLHRYNLFKKGEVMLRKKINLGSCSGQGLTEYAVVLSLVAIASIASMAFFGGAIKGKVAALSGAIAGQSIADVTAADQKAQKSAKEAAKRASDIKGNTSITNKDLFDQQNL